MLTIRGEPVELLINTVTLSPSENTDVHLFHCSGCGSSISQYQGMVTRIMPVIEPTEQVLVVNKCRGCGNLYTFQTAKTKKRESVRVTLRANINGYTEFFCFQGRQPVLKFNRDLIYSLSDHKKVVVPFVARCPKEDCPVEYHFVDLV